MPLLPGQSSPLLDLDSTHRGALVVIAGAIALSVTLVGLIVRLYIHIAVNPHYGNDDFFLLLATALAFCQSIVVFFSVSKGFGNSVELIFPEDLKVVRRIYYAGDILYLVILYLTKCCVLCILLKLTPKRAPHHRATWVAFILNTLLTIPSILMVSINCGFSHPVENAVRICKNLFLRWQIMVAFDVFTELCLFILAILLLRNLQMRFRRKLIVLSAFAARLPLIPFSLVRLYQFDQGIHSPNPSLELVSTSVWTQIHMHYSIIACTVFSLRTFTAAVSTHYGTAGSQAFDSGQSSRIVKEEGVNNDSSGSGASGSGSGSGGKRRSSLLSSAWYMGRDKVGGGCGDGDEEAMVNESQRKELEEEQEKGKGKGKGRERWGSISRSRRRGPKTTPYSQQRFSMGRINIELRPLSMMGKGRSTAPKQPEPTVTAPRIPGVVGMADDFAQGSDDLPQTTATVTRNPAGGGSGGGDGSGRRHIGHSGQGSGDSTKLVIQRDVEYSVQYRSRGP